MRAGGWELLIIIGLQNTNCAECLPTEIEAEIGFCLVPNRLSLLLKLASLAALLLPVFVSEIVPDICLLTRTDFPFILAGHVFQ
jgi:hypothetical protein